LAYIEFCVVSYSLLLGYWSSSS